MSVKQRLTIWVVTLVIVVVTGLMVSRASEPAFPPLSLREPVLPLPNPNIWMSPAASGTPFLLFVVENTPEARPQAGLADACLVFSIPTEGRITRFMAAYCGRRPETIGPIRSVRKYMLDLAGDLGAIVVHAGHSAEALALITGRRLPVVNQFWTSQPFWREPGREMPHNLYTSFEGVASAVQKNPRRTARRPLPFSFSYDAGGARADTSPATIISLDYGSLYGVRYAYQASHHYYLRSQDGRPHLDADGRQIAARSVIVLSVKWDGFQIRGKAASRIRLTGEGPLTVFTGGHMFEGTWTRQPAGPLFLKDAAGARITLPPGPVWVELLPNDISIAARAEGSANGR